MGGFFQVRRFFFSKVFLFLTRTRRVLSFTFVLVLTLFYILRLLVQHPTLLACGLGRLHLHRGRDSQASLRGMYLLLVLVHAAAVLTGGVDRQVLCPVALGGAGGAGGLGRAGRGGRGRGGGCGTGGRRSGGGSPAVGRQEAAELGPTGQVRDPLLFVHHGIDQIGIRRSFLE